MTTYKYPETKKIPQIDVIHGIEIEDDYVWLEDAKNQEVIEWVKSQNDYTDQYFQNNNEINFELLKEKIFEENKNISYSALTKSGDKLYATRVNEKGEACLVILDEDFEIVEIVADEKTFPDGFKPNSMIPNPKNQNLLIIDGMIPGQPKPTTFMYDSENKIILNRFENAFFSYWAMDGESLFISETEIDRINSKNINRVKRFCINSNNMETVFTYDNNSIYISCRQSSDGRYLFMNVARDYINFDIYFYDTLNKVVETVVSGEKATFQYVGTIEDKHYIQTNYECEFGKIVAIPSDNPTFDKAKTIIESKEKIMNNMIEHPAFVKDNQIYINYLKDVSAEIEIFSKNGEYISCIKAPCEIGMISKIGHSDSSCKRAEIFFLFESFTIPPSILSFYPETMESKVIYESRTIKNTDFVIEQIFVTVRDGEKVPAYVVYKKGIELNGENPTIMYGYGGYGLLSGPKYRNGIIGLPINEWIEKGYIYVVCNVRGGGEYGVRWHKAGNLMNKKNAFFDFIDITEWLIKNKYTNPEKIAIVGCSNGGLLVAALGTLRPDLFKVVVCSVGHTDMIRFKNDSTGAMYKTEYGDLENEEMFKYLLSYSPYHNIKKEEKYPSMIIQSGEKDNNVPAYHSKKFAAKLQQIYQGNIQAENKSENPILLRILADGGHNRGTGEVMYRTFSELQGFIYKELGVK